MDGRTQPSSDRERDKTEGEKALEMIAPPMKRFCSSVVSGVRKIAVEGNIGSVARDLSCR